MTYCNISILTYCTFKKGLDARCVLCQKLPWRQGQVHCWKHWIGSLEEHGPGLPVFALNMEENVSELMLLKHLGLYLAVIKVIRFLARRMALT